MRRSTRVNGTYVMCDVRCNGSIHKYHCSVAANLHSFIPWVKLNAPGPSMVPAAKLIPMAGLQVCWGNRQEIHGTVFTDRNELTCTVETPSWLGSTLYCFHFLFQCVYSCRLKPLSTVDLLVYVNCVLSGLNF